LADHDSQIGIEELSLPQLGLGFRKHGSTDKLILEKRYWQINFSRSEKPGF